MMKLTNRKWTRAAAQWIGVCLIGMSLARTACALSMTTTTIQGIAYLANGLPGSGTLQLSWPAFSTAANQAVVAGRTTVAIAADGMVDVSLAPNAGALPAGLYYTAVYHMSDGTTSTEYWVVPATGSASIAQVRAQVMPAAQAVQAVSKAYVDQAIQSLAQGSLASVGGTLTGPLYLNGDPSQALQAADKHYVDSTFAQAVPLTGAALSGPLTSVQLGAAYQVDQFLGADFGAKLQACLGKVSATYGGTCDARNFTGSQSMSANLAISTANTTIMLPCATISTANQIIVSAGTRNVALRGCALRGASNASGSQGGTVFLYSGSGAMMQVGDPTYAADTPGFHFDNAVINTTASTSSTAQGLAAYRTQEMDLQSLYFLGNATQTGMTLDGTGNYTGGTYYDLAFNGYQTAVNAIGHQTANPATTDWLNASTFVRLHIDCPTNNANPIIGTFGINLQQGDGNTFSDGDVEGCGTALHLGSNAQNNTIVGLRNENSSNQVVAESGSAYNNWITGGTMFTGELTDNGTRNSFLDTFHRSFNSLNGDWYGSQQDATITNHYRVGIGTGNERGLLNRYQTDYGYRWTTGFSDATAGEQFYQVLDELNNVYRLSIGQYNNGQSSANNQTVINAAGTGAVVLNGSSNSGTGGVVFGSGGPTETTVATINNSGNAQFNGSLQVGGVSMFSGSTTVRNQADAEIDAFLWAGATTDQKESYIYKDYTGASQWYMVKDASNNWALNSATGGLDSFKAYQSTNSGDTYINASNPSGVVRVNYETGAGTGFSIYGGNSSTLYASFTASNAVKFPGLKAASGTNCLQIDSSGYITNTGAACGTGSGSGVVNSGSAGQIAFYNASGTSVSGMNAVPVSAGGTGATTPATALAALGAASLATTAAQNFSGSISSPAVNASVNSRINVMAAPYNAKGDCVTDDYPAISAALQAAYAANPPLTVYIPPSLGDCYLTSTLPWLGVSLEGPPASDAQVAQLRSKSGQDLFNSSDANDSARQQPRNGFRVSNLKFVVDDSTDVSSSHPYRLPGRTSADGNMTAGSAVFTQTNGNLGLGDVGQAIVVCGAGPSGNPHPVCSGTNNLITTVASYQSPSQVTLAAQATATPPANTTVYIAYAGMSATQTVGNCAFALDSRDANAANWKVQAYFGFINSGFDHVQVASLSGTAKNNSCAFFMQGANVPYNVSWDYVDLWQLVYGYQTALFNQNVTSSGEGGDFNAWHHGYWSSTYPFTFYDGNTNTIEEIELGNASNGPQILSVNTPDESLPGGWYINIPEMEDTIGGGVDLRLTGLRHTLVNTSSSNNPWYWDASYSRCIQCNAAGGLKISGNLNNIELSDFVDFTLTHGLTNIGIGNHIGAGRVTSPYQGVQNPRQYTLQPERIPPAGAKTADFISHGLVSSSYGNDLDLWIWPQDMQIQFGSSGGGILTPDSASETGYNISVTNGNQLSNVTSFSGVNTAANGFVIGSGIPAGKVNIYFRVKCSSAQSVNFYDGITGTLVTYPNCGTSYSTGMMTVDYTSHSGSQPQPAFNVTTGTMYLAWMAIRPWNGDEWVNGTVYAQNLNGNLNGTLNGIALTGGGAAIPTGPSSATSGDLTTFTGTQGQIQDSGIALSSLAGLASPSFTGTITAPTINATANYQVNGTPIAAANLSNGTTGSGNVVLASGPTFRGNTTTFANAAAAEQDVIIQPGSTADQTGAVQWNNYSGAAQWKLRKDASNYLRLTDSVNSLDRTVFYQGGQTILNSGGGSNAVVLNGSANSGTGGLLVQNGGSSPSTVFTVTGSGNTTATGFIAGKFMAGSGAMTPAAGSAAGTSPTIGCTASHVCDGISGAVTLTTGTSPSTGTLATLTFPSAHANYANCVVSVASGTAQLTSVTWSESATALTLTANSALSAGTAYQIRYWCGGF